MLSTSTCSIGQKEANGVTLTASEASLNATFGGTSFEALFGGEMLLTDPSGKSEFVEVRGRKAISGFKRTLRERGAEFAVLTADASSRVVKLYSQYRTRPSTVIAVRNPNC
jgi:hypothetical protein